MEKRGSYKLQEFVAHASNVNCLSIGKKSSRLLVTGGEDQKVNLWAIGTSDSLLSLSGHTSPVESVTFDATEVLVVSGASFGVIKLWDLEEAKVLRTLTGHRSSCNALEFHPFGEFFASGSSDTSLKIWDVRKKGCIHTYKGHTRGVSTVRFSPDGRWVVSGGADNVVKIWDLTAGKLMHEFKFHEGQIQCIDFHPLEFLLSTGSADRTVKFWDLETFEMIGSAGPEATGVRSMAFHPDGKTLFCGLEDSLKVFSWEPIICHDSVDMGWSTLGDLNVHEGKLLGCSYYHNCIGVWAADISIFGPFVAGVPSRSSGYVQSKFDIQESLASKEVKNVIKTNSRFPPTSHDVETPEIRNIYVDTSGSNKITPKIMGSTNFLNVVHPLDASETSSLSTLEKSLEVQVLMRSSSQHNNRQSTVPSTVARSNSYAENVINSRREVMIRETTAPGMVPQRAHRRRESNSNYETEKLSETAELGGYSSKFGASNITIDPNSRSRLVSKVDSGETVEDSHKEIMNVAEHFKRVLSPEVPTSSSRDSAPKTQGHSREISTLRNTNEAQLGRTRSLVERWEKRETCSTGKALSNTTTNLLPESHTATHLLKEQPQKAGRESPSMNSKNVFKNQMRIHEDKLPQESGRESAQGNSEKKEQPQKAGRESPSMNSEKVFKNQMQNHEDKLPQAAGREPAEGDSEKKEQPQKASILFNYEKQKAGRESPSMNSKKVFKNQMRNHEDKLPQASGRESAQGNSEKKEQPQKAGRELPSMNSEKVFKNQIRNHEDKLPQAAGREPAEGDSEKKEQPQKASILFNYEKQKAGRESPSMNSEKVFNNQMRNHEDKLPQASGRESAQGNSEKKEQPETSERELASMNSEKVLQNLMQNHEKEQTQTSGRESASMNNERVLEDLMRNHDTFISSFHSRLAKLQVVRYFWQRNDIKGGLNAVGKLPDHSVQADVVGVLIDRMDIVSLELFSCLLPMLLGLLNSQIDRHATVSLEMLLKLVAIFGPVILLTVSASTPIGVDLQAERRRECCSQCLIQLQKIKQIIPSIIRRGGLHARYTHELNLLLQEF